MNLQINLNQDILDFTTPPDAADFHSGIQEYLVRQQTPHGLDFTKVNYYETGIRLDNITDPFQMEIYTFCNMFSSAFSEHQSKQYLQNNNFRVTLTSQRQLGIYRNRRSRFAELSGVYFLSVPNRHYDDRSGILELNDIRNRLNYASVTVPPTDLLPAVGRGFVFPAYYDYQIYAPSGVGELIALHWEVLRP